MNCWKLNQVVDPIVAGVSRCPGCWYAATLLAKLYSLPSKQRLAAAFYFHFEKTNDDRG